MWECTPNFSVDFILIHICQTGIGGGSTQIFNLSKSSNNTVEIFNVPSNNVSCDILQKCAHNASFDILQINTP